MATNSDLSGILDSLDLPVVIGGWDEDEVAKFPCVEYHRETPSVLHGSDGNYFTTDRWLVSVYFKQADAPAFWEHCNTLENALSSCGVAFRRSSDLFHDGLMSAQYSFSLIRD